LLLAEFSDIFNTPSSLPAVRANESFEVVYGRPPPTLALYQPDLSRVAALDKQLTNRDEFLAAVRERLLQAQSIMMQSHDAARQDVSFSVDDRVWLRLHQCTVTAIKSSQNAKLALRYYGPFNVIERIVARLLIASNFQTRRASTVFSMWCS
jgi:hypothetical protein